MKANQAYVHHCVRDAAHFEKHKKGRSVELLTFESKQKPQIYSIEHETIYSYTKKTKRSTHLLRLQPVHDLHQQVLSFELDVSPHGVVRNFTGVFGNHATFVEISKPYSSFKVSARSIVAVSEIPKHRFKKLHQPRTIPLIWMPWDRVMMQSYLQPPELPESELFSLADYAMSFARKNRHDVLDVLSDINHTIHNEYTYEPGSTTLYTSPYEIFVNKRGVCQDFANLFICLARLLDVPARYRVGYVFTGGRYENATDESHAWVEVYLPYIGWIGYDPTNGSMTGTHHIRVSCGRHYQDATPTSGTIFSGGGEESLKVSVKVLKLN
jgi:transglutaminase-like putative cysteine protease